jgi:GNAT superfamily N-acetyltransferase
MAGRAWARGFGVTLRVAQPADLEAPGIEQALRDGIERGYAGELPDLAPGTECYAIEVDRALAGILAFVRDAPQPSAAAVRAIVIAPEHRGHAYAARALLVAERRLSRDGLDDFYSRVPRGNGRGMYFMLRCGYAPVAPLADDGATWFRRNLKLAGRPPVGLPVAWQQPRQPAASGSSGGS